jgi:hypothetical protein
MTHFSVLVCLPADTALRELEARIAEVMAPWDEDLTVVAYRSYEEGSAEDFWLVSSIRRGAEQHRALVGLGERAFVDRRVVELVAAGHGERKDLRARVEAAVERAAPGWATDAALAAKLVSPMTWEAAVELYNAKFHPGNELAVVAEVPDKSDSSRLHYDPQTGRAFTWSTYNPASTWDYWCIGGGWRNYFIAKGPGAGLIIGERSWDSPDEPDDGLPHCDGGPKALLDFEAMREAAAREAHRRYDLWEAVCDDTPAAKSWSHFIDLVKATAMDIAEAREQYSSQPRIQKARASNLDDGWGECVVEEFLPDRDEYVLQARAAAVPGYALVTLDRQWLAPGRMGWFGLSSDGAGERQAYNVAASRYLDNLEDDQLVVVLDCHR